MPGSEPMRAGVGDTRRNGDSGDGETAKRGVVRRLAVRAAALMSSTLLCAEAWAQAAPERVVGRVYLGTLEVIQLALFVGITGAAMISAVLLIRERTRTAAENIELRGRVADLDSALQRSEALLNLKDQRILVWSGDEARPELIGHVSATGVPDDRSMFLAFGRWLSPRSAVALDRSIEVLRRGAERFDLVLETAKGGLLEVQGRSTAGHVAVRFLALTEARREHAELRVEHDRLAADHATVLALIDALDMPFWLRAMDGRLQWVNRAYATAVEAPGADAVAEDNRELFGTAAREQIARAHLSSPVAEQSLSTVIEGDRRVFLVTDVAAGTASAGLARDVSEIETVRAEQERTVRAHADTLDQLNTAVAIFDTAQKLRFYNHAFQELWQLDTAFLSSRPDHALLLDRLRLEGKLEEQPEWRKWKETLLSAYRALESQEHSWHLPDGRTLRVVANPQPDGGVTWVFENLTEKIKLQSQYQSAVRVQGETLDNLAEGVAVFGPDGRLRLSNPAFTALWGLPTDLVTPQLHISALRAACDPLSAANPWNEIVAAVTGFDEERRNGYGQVELNDGRVLRYAMIHLPNGQVMTTFVDVTDSVNVERALKDKNEALERADQLRSDFIHLVSYELRSPLTNIIGFTELLAQPETGPLSERQREYVDHVWSSSLALHTIVNDILDLATIDAGFMALEIGEVSVPDAVASAAELVSERLRDHRITLTTDIADAPMRFQADEQRLRQVLFNLLSNAANYAPEGGHIVLSCRAEAEGVAFSVKDDGPGIPPDVLDGIFRRFESRANGGRRRGAGLGLSIVKGFVELHGGTVSIDTGTGRGTTVTCRFPFAPEGFRAAAE